MLVLRISVISVKTEVERGWGWMEGIQPEMLAPCESMAMSPSLPPSAPAHPELISLIAEMLLVKAT